MAQGGLDGRSRSAPQPTLHGRCGTYYGCRNVWFCCHRRRAARITTSDGRRAGGQLAPEPPVSEPTPLSPCDRRLRQIGAVDPYRLSCGPPAVDSECAADGMGRGVGRQVDGRSAGLMRSCHAGLRGTGEEALTPFACRRPGFDVLPCIPDGQQPQQFGQLCWASLCHALAAGERACRSERRVAPCPNGVAARNFCFTTPG